MDSGTEHWQCQCVAKVWKPNDLPYRSMNATRRGMMALVTSRTLGHTEDVSELVVALRQARAWNRHLEMQAPKGLAALERRQWTALGVNQTRGFGLHDPSWAYLMNRWKHFWSMNFEGATLRRGADFVLIRNGCLRRTPTQNPLRDHGRTRPIRQWRPKTADRKQLMKLQPRRTPTHSILGGFAIMSLVSYSRSEREITILEGLHLSGRERTAPQTVHEEAGRGLVWFGPAFAGAKREIGSECRRSEKRLGSQARNPTCHARGSNSSFFFCEDSGGDFAPWYFTCQWIVWQWCQKFWSKSNSLLFLVWVMLGPPSSAFSVGDVNLAGCSQQLLLRILRSGEARSLLKALESSKIGG
ncbi:hypothetical protein BU15DRAFT_59204 [Melanogaster broomeanus]|nr:hypothetical protein BU15DRAFT_59204 [Melanogaster broomeanus]